ncbi:hypothetical protein Cni_G09951 [Canna indica]|uniref:Uncharacterized protein n=1 Tax=Canna indica TaxID=4628 RepID=A0AAQ3K3H4_9LILI|nr:hypothetical protein Cni_G09951 [Canna indica]
MSAKAVVAMLRRIGHSCQHIHPLLGGWDRVWRRLQDQDQVLVCSQTSSSRRDERRDTIATIAMAMTVVSMLRRFRHSW